MRRGIRPEEREWVVNHSEMPPVINKIRKCKKCKKILSVFNLDNYCFVHKSYIVKQNDDKIVLAIKASNSCYIKRKRKKGVKQRYA